MMPVAGHSPMLSFVQLDFVVNSKASRLAHQCAFSLMAVVAHVGVAQCMSVRILDPGTLGFKDTVLL